MESDITVFIIVIGNDIRQFGTSVSGECATRTGVTHRRNGSFRSACMIETFTFYIYIGGMGIPIHGKTRQKPVRLRLGQAGIGIRLCFQFIEHLFCPWFILY